MDQQGRLDLAGRGGREALQLGHQVIAERISRSGGARDVAHEPLHLRTAGKGAQLQADHRTLHPGAGLGNAAIRHGWHRHAG